MYHNMHCSNSSYKWGGGREDAIREENGVHRKNNHITGAEATFSREEPGEIKSCEDM